MPEVTVADPTPGRLLAHLAVRFAEEVRSSGLAAPMATVLAYRDALAASAGKGEAAHYWAGRACFVHGPDDVIGYDRAYAAFYLGQSYREQPIRVVQADAAPVEGEDDGDVGQPPEDAPPIPGASTREVLASKDFAELSGPELAEMHRAMSEIAFHVPLRRARRSRPDHHQHAALDLRRTVRRASRTAGEAVVLERRRRRVHARRLVAICDVSGSMDPYARELVRFLHVAVAGRPDVEAFSLGTRLTRLTRELAGHDPDAALRLAAAEVPDWAGGTRLGDGLRAFNDRYGVRGMARGAIVLLCSDGIDRGDPEVLEAELARLRRVAHRIIWVNPLKATPGYEPTTRGMAAALPFLDAFLPGHSLGALVEVAAMVGGLSATG